LITYVGSAFTRVRRRVSAVAVEVGGAVCAVDVAKDLPTIAAQRIPLVSRQALDIVTLDPANDYAVTSLATIDMTTIASDWGSYSIALALTAGAGQVLEFGLASTATYFQPSSVIYDNVSFAPVAEPSSCALMFVGLGIVGLAGRRRRNVVA